MSRAWEIANATAGGGGGAGGIQSDTSAVANSEEVKNIVYGYDPKDTIGDLPDGTIYIFVDPNA